MRVTCARSPQTAPLSTWVLANRSCVLCLVRAVLATPKWTVTRQDVKTVIVALDAELVSKARESVSPSSVVLLDKELSLDDVQKMFGSDADTKRLASAVFYTARTSAASSIFTDDESSDQDPKTRGSWVVSAFRCELPVQLARSALVVSRLLAAFPDDYALGDTKHAAALQSLVAQQMDATAKLMPDGAALPSSRRLAVFEVACVASALSSLGGGGKVGIMRPIPGVRRMLATWTAKIALLANSTSQVSPLQDALLRVLSSPKSLNLPREMVHTALDAYFKAGAPCGGKVTGLTLERTKESLLSAATAGQVCRKGRARCPSRSPRSPPPSQP